ncbi:MAG: phosphotransferase [Tissierellales bacterium]
MTAFIDRIRFLHGEEQRQNSVPIEPTDLPTSFEAITPQWLTAVLCRNTPGAEVEALTLGEPDNGTYNRRKITVRYNPIGESQRLPTKLFCKATHELQNRIVMGVSGALVCETVFYNDVRPLLNIEAPIGLFANYDPESCNSMLIMEDLSDRVEAFCSHDTPMNQRRLESQMELLANFHSRFLTSPELSTVLSKLVTFPEFLRKSMEFGFEAASNQGFLDGVDVIPPSLYKRYAEIWPKTLASAEKHDLLPQTFIHNDVHLKNWYCLPGDKMGLSDWQCCGRGHWSRDLAYTLATACSVEDRRHWERDLIAFYLDKMREGGAAATSFDEAWHHYRQQMLSVLAFWTITLSPPADLPDMQPRDTTLAFIHRIATAVDDLGSLDLD